MHYLKLPNKRKITLQLKMKQRTRTEQNASGAKRNLLHKAPHSPPNKPRILS